MCFFYYILIFLNDFNKRSNSFFIYKNKKNLYYMDTVNSFATLAEKITILNKNCVEILTKVNDLVASEQDSVNIIYDDNGAINSFSQPTVGYLKNQIDGLNQNMKRLSSIDGYTYVRDGLSYKRIMTSDLNREPVPMNEISQVKTFTPVNNHFFESLMNPMLAVTIDLTDKVEQVVNKIVSRRYILRFEKNPDGSLTENGLRSFNSYASTFLNKTQINISDFIAWYDNPSNNGLVVDTVKPYDEQIYDMSLKTLNYYGVFSVIKVEIDDINNKMWYHLNDIKYYGNDGSIKTLSIGDELIINKINSSSRYKVREVNTDYSNTKIRLENIEGYDPVIVGVNVLKYYSDISSQKSVQINVGFDEYVILFIKPINTDDNIVGSLWSKGISFYTNDLVLDINNNINLSNYYVDAVYDYGTLLKDLLNKTIPTTYGSTPNPVILTAENFKVVQINKHLTDDKDQTTLLKTHANKSSVKTEINQIKTAIEQKSSKLSSGGLTSTEKQTYLNEINKLKSDLNISTNNLSSLITQITELNSGTNSKIEPKYRVRGFWTIPEPIATSKTQPQHVIQFRIQYRYSSKSGNSNNVQTFNYVKPSTATISTTTTTSGIKVQINPLTGVRTGGNSALPTNNQSFSSGSMAAAISSTNNEEISRIKAAIAELNRKLTDPNLTEIQKASYQKDLVTLNNNLKRLQSGTSSTSTAINTGKTTPIVSTEVSTTTETPTNTPNYANFSNWVELLSDVRKRHWDETSKQWYWKIEDVSDAETPNINQIDIPITQNERVEIRIKAISEVGWPDSLIESDWSNVLTVDFPDDLMNILSDNDYIINEAKTDKGVVELETTLQSKGVNRHIEDSYTINQEYFSHKDTSIQVSIKSDQNVSMNLYQYLTYLTNKITSLEQQIAGSKGTLNVALYKNSTLLKTITNNTTTIINIECEDYATAVSGRTYYNDINVIDDYIVSFENTNQSGNLGFLSNRLYTSGGTNSFYSDGGDLNKVLIVDHNNDLYTQKDNQFIWFADKDSNEWTSTGATSASAAPIYLNSSDKNLGTTGTTVWNVKDIFGAVGSTDLLCSVFPYLPDVNSFVENGQDKTKIIKPQNKFNVGMKLFFKLDGLHDTSTPTLSTYITPSSNNNVTKNRKIKIWFETNNNTNFQFVINFNIKRFRNFMKPKVDPTEEPLNIGGSSKFSTE